MTKRWQAAHRFWQGALLVAILLCGPAAIRANPDVAIADAPSVHARYDQLIQARIDYYNSLFPSIHFVHLRGGMGWSVDMQFLPLLLGADATSLDYEHPKSLRQDLMQVSLKRLEIMLRDSQPSASLFRKGTAGLARRENVCVITLNTDALGTTDLEMTQEMLDLPATTVAQIHPARYLDSEDHVLFAIDHEVFHCFDALYNGPVPQSRKPYARNLAAFRSESGADAFAVAMNIRRHGYLTRYARNIMNIRALALINDPDHCTWATIQHVMELNPETITAAPAETLFAVASRIRDMRAPNYDQYVAYRVAVHELQAQLKSGSLEPLPQAQGGGTRGSGDRAATLARQTRFWFKQLFLDEPLDELRHQLLAMW